ncbi:MAG: metallophosphoesterase family protein [Anaerolineales bacterium]|nr:MAG: metallophosphoesterase family protein [Anaerolineales bacterium]
MRVLVISDIHANLTALEAVLTHANHVDAVWCLGDLVGYGPDPNECISTVRTLPNLQCILGNHDAAVLKQIDSSAFNPEARQVIFWTQSELTDANLDFLANLPERVQQDQVTLVHGSPRQPVWEYLLDTQNATRSFAYFDSVYCFVGHTHLPVIYQQAQEDQSATLFIPEANTNILLKPRAILNPGSVGQPRDRDPRAAYAIYNPQEQTWEYHRVPYDVSSVQNRMQAAKLPDRHIQRLSSGW